MPWVPNANIHAYIYSLKRYIFCSCISFSLSSFLVLFILVVFLSFLLLIMFVALQFIFCLAFLFPILTIWQLFFSFEDVLCDITLLSDFIVSFQYLSQYVSFVISIVVFFLFCLEYDQVFMVFESFRLLSLTQCCISSSLQTLALVLCASFLISVRQTGAVRREPDQHYRILCKL